MKTYNSCDQYAANYAYLPQLPTTGFRLACGGGIAGAMMKTDLAHLRRAVQLIKARKPADVLNKTRGESRVIQSTSDWYYGSDGVSGIGIGRKFNGSTLTDEPSIYVFVKRKDPAIPHRSAKRIRPFTLHGKPVQTQIIEIRNATLDFTVGGYIGGPGQNTGTLGGLLTDDSGQFYALSAAHVLCETMNSTTSAGQRLPIIKGDGIYAFDSNGAQPVRIGELLDRRILDFSNIYPVQNVDAAIALLVGDAATQVDPTTIPYGPPDTASHQDLARVIGAVSQGNSTFQPISSISSDISGNGLQYLNPQGMMQPIALGEVHLGTYSSQSGDSGGPVVRPDGRVIGMHIGRTSTDKGDLPIFFDIARVLGAWPSLRLICKPSGQ